MSSVIHRSPGGTWKDVNFLLTNKDPLKRYTNFLWGPHPLIFSNQVCAVKAVVVLIFLCCCYASINKELAPSSPPLVMDIAIHKSLLVGPKTIHHALSLIRNSPPPLNLIRKCPTPETRSWNCTPIIGNHKKSFPKNCFVWTSQFVRYPSFSICRGGTGIEGGKGILHSVYGA